MTALTFGGGGYSDDLAGWSLGGSYGTFNTGADYYGNDMTFAGQAADTALLGGGGIVGWQQGNQDAIEQARLGQGYPNNGQPFDVNAALMGVTRLVDTAVKGYTVVKGAQAATYAGQNGLTYVNGRGTVASVGLGGLGNLLPLLLVGGLVLLLTKD